MTYDAPPPPQGPYNYGNQPPQQPKKKGWIPAAIVGGIVAFLLIIGVVLAIVLNNGDDDKPTPASAPTATVAPTTVAPAPTTEAPAPTTEAPEPTTAEPTPTALATPSYIETGNLNVFVSVIRDEPSLDPTDSLSDDQIKTLGVASCVILDANNGDAIQTVLDVRKASDNKLSLQGAGFLVGASQAGLCPSVKLVTPAPEATA